MTTFPKPKARPENTPAWLKAARGYYGDAFETNKKEKLAESMADWCEMDADERGFVLAHLQYLNLLAQRGTQRLLLELRAMLEEVGDELIEVVESAAAELEEGEGDEEPGEDEDDFAAVEQPMPQPTLAAVPDPEPTQVPDTEVVDAPADEGEAPTSPDAS